MDRAVACPLLGRGPRKRSAMAASRVALGGAWGTLAHTGLPSKGVKSDSSAAEDTEVPLGKTGGGVQNFLRGMATSRKATERGPGPWRAGPWSQAWGQAHTEGGVEGAAPAFCSPPSPRVSALRAGDTQYRASEPPRGAQYCASSFQRPPLHAHPSKPCQDLAHPCPLLPSSTRVHVWHP